MQPTTDPDHMPPVFGITPDQRNRYGGRQVRHAGRDRAHDRDVRIVTELWELRVIVLEDAEG